MRGVLEGPAATLHPKGWLESRASYTPERVKRRRRGTCRTAPSVRRTRAATAPVFASSDAERACRSCAGLLGIPCPDTQKSRVLDPLGGHALKPALLGASAVTAKLVPAWEGNMNKAKVWMRCQVSPGMFSDERTVEVEGRYFFVEEVSVRNVGADGWGELEVTIIERDGHRWAVLPTNYSDSVLLEA